jgi:ferredoxin-NADP reductase
MKDNLTSLKKGINKVFVVGPVPFMDDVKRDILQSGIVNRDQIFLV